MSDRSRLSSDLTDDALINRLLTEEDRLPREAVDEIISRGPQMVDPLTWLVMNPAAWQSDTPARWAAIHATFLLGAIGGESVVLGLLTAADHAETSRCGWVLDVLPAIFGRFGRDVRPVLSERVRDPKRGALSRASMAECLAATTAWQTAGADAVFGDLGSVFAETQDPVLKRVVGNVLLDFKRIEHRDALLAYTRNQARGRHDETDVPAFTTAHVEQALTPEARPNLARYTVDWLTFYSSTALAERQGRRTERPADTAEVDVVLEAEEWKSDHIAQVVHDGPKIGRNAACPCGSGKTYTQCCLDIDSALGPLNSLA